MAWSRIARETGAEYLALKLDDPSFTAPVYASLVQSDQRRAQAHLVAMTDPRRPASRRGASTRPCSPARDSPPVASQPSERGPEPSDRHSPRPEHPFFRHARDAAGRHTVPEFPSRRSASSKQCVEPSVIKAFANV
jgi:hypothetical protein